MVEFTAKSFSNLISLLSATYKLRNNGRLNNSIGIVDSPLVDKSIACKQF